MTVREIFLLFRLTLYAITWVPFLSPFACFVVMTAVSTWAPLASAARPGTRRVAVPGLGPGSMSYEFSSAGVAVDSGAET